MTFTPLIPLPKAGESESATPDPFDELLRPAQDTTSSSTTSAPLFPASSRRTPVQPISVPDASAPLSSDPASEATLLTPGSANSDFGAFVSVDPTQDPLGSSNAFGGFGSVEEEPSSIGLPGGAEDVIRRADQNEKRIMDELLVFEQDPTSLLASGSSSKPSTLVSSPPAVEYDQFTGLADAFDEMDFAERRAPLSLPSTSTTSSRLSPRTPNMTSPEPSTSRMATPTASGIHTPISSSHPSTIHSHSESTPPSSMSSSFSSYLSGTLPKKWGGLLRSPSSSAIATQAASAVFDQPSHYDVHSPHLVHAATMPISGAPGHGNGHAPVAQNASTGSLTHQSPFAAHPFIPPSGAPGFDGDRKWDKGFEFSPEQKIGKPVDLVGRSDSARLVLTPALAQLLRPHLQPLFRLSSKWSLLYSLDQHGLSLSTFYSRVSPHANLSGCLLAVRDADDGVFGVWMGDGIRRSTSTGVGRGYFGSGESFLWRMEVGKGQGKGVGVKVFKWTGKNDYVALCEADSISFGGGDGKYGLFVDGTLDDGSSAPCPTFDNEPLSGDASSTATQRFECVGLEAWAISR